MTCRQWQRLMATAEAGELEENVALQEHLSKCSQCARFAEEMQAVSRAARSLPPLTPGPDFADKVRRRIEDEPRSQAAECPEDDGAPREKGLSAATALLPMLRNLFD